MYSLNNCVHCQVCLMSQSWDNVASVTLYDQYMLTKQRDIVHVQTVSCLCILYCAHAQMEAA